MRILRKLASPVSEFGFFAGLLYLVDAALRRLSPQCRLYYYEIMVQPIKDEPLLPPSLTKHLEFREVRRGDPEIALMPARDEIKEQRLDQDAVCLGAYRRGKFVGYIWLSFGAYREDEVRCTFVLERATESVFDYDLYVFPEYRMGLAFPGIWTGANAYLRTRGVKYTFSRVTRFNVASRRAHSHLGWRPVGRVVFLKVGQAELMLGTIAPYVHLSLRRGDRVRLILGPEALSSTILH